MTNVIYVPSLIWTGNCEDLYKVPFHTFGKVKKRHLRLKACEPNSVNWVDVAIVNNATAAASDIEFMKAAYPLALVWGDTIRPSSASLSTASPAKSAFLPSPLKKRVKEENEIPLQDIIEITSGNNTAAFQAFVAKNGRSCIPHSSCCFSIVTAKRSVDFFVSSGGVSSHQDAAMAYGWVDSLQSLLHGFHKKQLANIDTLQSTLQTIRNKGLETQSKELFEAASRGDTRKLRYLFDSGMPVDYMDDTSGDTVLILASRLGHYDVCRLALHEYQAKNDPHPAFGQTALQVAVSSGHAKIVKLILDTAEPSRADRSISNHEDGNGEAPIHVASRCGSVKIMELLCTHGANLGLVDKRGRTCLHCAASMGHASCIEFALDFGADDFIEIKQVNGFTCLHLAIKSNSNECVRILLTAGADVAAETADGCNAYELASKQRNQGIMKILLEYDRSSHDYGDSCSDSYGDQSSLSDDMFDGLNTYTITPAPKKFLPPSHERIDQQTPSTYSYFTAQQTPGYFSSTPGRFLSPHPSYSPGMSPYGHGGLYNHQGVLGSHQYYNPGGNSMHYTDMTNADSQQFEHQGDVWTVCYTDDNYPYYFNSSTNVSTWDDPRATEQQNSEELDSLPQPSPVTTDMSQGQNQLVQEKESNLCIQTEEISSSTRTIDIQSSSTPQQSHGTMPTCNKQLNLATPSRQEPASNTHQPSNGLSSENEIKGPIDPRAALIDMLNKRNPPPNATEEKPESKPISRGSSQQPNDPNLNDKDETPDPRAALMEMLKQRNPSYNVIKEVEKAATPTESKDQSKKIETDSGDPRAALMAMLKNRKSSSDSEPRDVTSPKKSPKQLGDDKVKESTDNATAITPQKTKGVSKDELTNDPVLQKYMKMTSFGVPPEAVVQKMQQELIGKSKIDLFKGFHGLIEMQQSIPSKEDLQNVPSKEELSKDSVLSKYVRMTKVGVPIPAVCSKMTQDMVDPAKIQLFEHAFGVAKSPKRSPKPNTAIPLGRRRASTALQKIHWNTVADERLLRNSVWAANDESELDASDIEKLEMLFASVQNQRASNAVKKATSKKDVKKTSLIDPKRANNIAIALAQYRTFENYDSLVHAVVTLDEQHLNSEKLQNMQLLLPKKDEINRLKHYNGKIVEGLGRAELFFMAVMKVPRFSQKLSAFIYSLQFEEATTALFSNLHTLSRACQEVITSKNLTAILRRFLAIGNLMNESSGKPAANGITLDSLIKTAKMKGTDGRTTILDSVISRRLDLADLRAEMPTVRDAMRLDVADLISNLKEIESGANEVQLAIQAEKSDVDSSEDGLITESSEKFLQKLEPFHARASKEIVNIKDAFDHVEKQVHKMCQFFAEDLNTKASTIFDVLLEFAQLVERSAEHLRRREAAKRRESLRTPVKSSHRKV